MLKKILKYFSSDPPIVDREGLIRFADSQASFVSQKSTTEYCRSRAGINWDKLMLERDFLDVINVSRWQAYLHALEDILVVMEGRLRDSFGDQADVLPRALTAVAAECIARHHIAPPDDQGWTPHLAKWQLRLEYAQKRPPAIAQEIAKVAGEKIFKDLPIHSAISHHDRQLVINSVRFLMLDVSAKMRNVVVEKLREDPHFHH